jgi:hypothetical protein
MGLLEWVSRVRTEPGSWTETAVDIGFGVIAGSLRVSKLGWNSLYLHAIRPLSISLGISDAHDHALPTVENGTIKVALLGYGRTGTVSFVFFMSPRGKVKSIFGALIVLMLSIIAFSTVLADDGLERTRLSYCPYNPVV